LRGIIVFTVLAIVVGSIGCERPRHARVASVRAPVIYGADDREELVEQSDPEIRKIARSIIALIDPADAASLLDASDEDGGVATHRLALCDGERFASEPSLARCTGFLVAEDMLVTAGHCFETGDACDRFRYVTGFAIGDDAAVGPNVAERRCREIVAREVGVLDDGSTVDYAVVALRPSPESAAVAVQQSDRVAEVGQAVSSFGFPSGFPLKIDRNGRVVESGDTNFRALVDAFDGSSGSPLVGDDQRVLGFLVRGQQDYAWDPAQFCYRANLVAEDAGVSELAMHIGVVLHRACVLSGVRGLCRTSEILDAGADAPVSIVTDASTTALSDSGIDSGGARHERSRTGNEPRSSTESHRLGVLEFADWQPEREAKRRPGMAQGCQSAAPGSGNGMDAALAMVGLCLVRFWRPSAKRG
jgi:hypothetical protein